MPNQEQNSKKSILVLLIITVFLASCEGFKTLTIYNKTGKEITIETRPEIPRFKHYTFPDTAQILSGSKVYQLRPNETLSLLTTFGRTLFNAKIKAADLPIDYLRIETPTETLIANSRSEIIKLSKKPSLKYKKADKKYALDDNKNLEAIIVRQ